MRGDGVMGSEGEGERDGWRESDGARVRGEREGELSWRWSEVAHDVKTEAHGDKTFKWEVYNLW